MIPNNFFQYQQQHQHLQQGFSNPFMTNSQRRTPTSRENPFGIMEPQNRN
jgi:hypothetical protein